MTRPPSSSEIQHRFVGLPRDDGANSASCRWLDYERSRLSETLYTVFRRHVDGESDA